MGVLAVDLGGSNLRTGWCDNPPGWQALTAVSWRQHGFPLDIDWLAAYLQYQIADCETSVGVVNAVGIAVAAVIDPTTGNVKVGENLGWRNVSLQALLEDRLRKPVFVDVDAFCGALAEARLGNGVDQEHFLYVVLGTGIGHGLVLNRRVWRGVHAAANVFGHIKVGRGATPCYCGGQDCLCQYASGDALTQLAALQGTPRIASGANVVEAYRRQERWAAEAVETMHQTLALAVSHAFNLLDIACVIFGGGVIQPDFPDLADLQQRLETLVYPEIRPIILRRAALQKDAVLTGAALLAQDNLKGEAL
jgi:glucokinase